MVKSKYHSDTEFIRDMTSLSKKEKEQIIKEIREEERILKQDLEEALNQGYESRYWIKHLIPGPQDPNFPKYLRFNSKTIGDPKLKHQGIEYDAALIRMITKEEDNNRYHKKLILRIEGNIPEEQQAEIKKIALDYKSSLTEIHNRRIKEVYIKSSN